MSDHTPTPWQLVPSTEHHGPYIVAEYGGDICDFYAMSNYLAASVRNGGTSFPIHHQGETADANAAFAVRAVNVHDDLLAVLRETREFFVKWLAPPLRSGLVAKIDAALAKAEGRS